MPFSFLYRINRSAIHGGHKSNIKNCHTSKAVAGHFVLQGLSFADLKVTTKVLLLTSKGDFSGNLLNCHSLRLSSPRVEQGLGTFYFNIGINYFSKTWNCPPRICVNLILHRFVSVFLLIRFAFCILYSPTTFYIRCLHSEDPCIASEEAAKAKSMKT